VIGFLDRAVAGARCGRRCAAPRRADRKDAAGTGWDSLTPSEQEVAWLIAAGMTNSQVATRLGMSPHNVDGRLRRVFAKLGVNTPSRAHRRIRARHRLIPPAPRRRPRNRTRSRLPAAGSAGVHHQV